MTRILLIAVLVLLVAHMFWRVIDAVIEGAGGKPPRQRGIRPSVKLMKDPVCGTWVTPREEFSLTRAGETHYFCSEKCRREFRR